MGLTPRWAVLDAVADASDGIDGDKAARTNAVAVDRFM